MNSALAAMGFGVVNPAMLAGGALVAAPIIIHLLSRRRYRQLDWGAMRFLLEADKKNRRRIRLEQWLLLALRCLAMLLLALIMSRPFVRPGFLSALLGGRGSVARVIVLDDSASLSYREGPEPQFARLRTAADRLLAWLHEEAPGDPVSIYLCSAPTEPLAHGQRFRDDEFERLRRKLAETPCSVVPAHPRQALERVVADLDAGGRRVQADVYVFSDFQKDEWSAGTGQSGVFAPLRGATDTAGEARPRAATLDARLVLVNVNETPRENVAVTYVRLDRPQTIAGVPATVRATVTNYSSRPATDVELSVDVAGAPIPVDSIPSIGAGESKTVSVEATFADAGFAELEIGLSAGDRYPIDDRRRVAVSVVDAIRVLLIDGQPSPDPYQDEVFLLRTALAPLGPFGSGLRVDVSDTGGLATAELASYDCVMLCNAGDVAEPQADALRRYVSAGGGLVIFLGDEIQDAESYNRVLGTDAGGLLPLALRGTVNATAPGVGLVRVGEHAITAMFPGGEETLSEYVHFRTYFESTAPLPNATSAPASAAADEPASAILARYADAAHTPAIAERRLGAGRVVLFTTSCDLAWNDWGRSLDGSFVITMLETVHSTARRSTHPLEFSAGGKLAATVFPEQHELSAVFKSPKFPEDPASETKFEQAGALPTQPVALVGPIARHVGVWQVDVPRRSGGTETRTLCVNADPAESNLMPATKGELADAAAGVPFDYIPAAENFLRGSQHARRELWPGLVAALAAVLFAEQALAWAFGGGLSRLGDSRVVALARGLMRRKAA